jgi:hypothetical protein
LIVSNQMGISSSSLGCCRCRLSHTPV